MSTNVKSDFYSLKESYQRDGFVNIENFLDKRVLEDLKYYIKSSDLYKEQTKEKDNVAPAMTKAVKGKNIHFRNDSSLLKEWIEDQVEQSDIFGLIAKLAEKDLIRTHYHVVEIARV